MSKKLQVVTEKDNFIMTDVKRRKVENIQQVSSNYQKDKNYLQYSKNLAETIYQKRVLQNCK